MPTIKRFEDLEIWQQARTLNIRIIPFLKILEDTRNFELKRQLDDAAGSVMDNIAEGFEREGNKEFTQFLAIAKGSLGETRSQLYHVFDRTLMGETELNKLQADCIVLAGKIGTLMNYLKACDIKGNKYRKKSI